MLFTTGYSADAARLQRQLGEELPLLAEPYQPEGLLREVREVLDG